MSEFGQLKNGFVSWQGQRVFVPWLSAPRIVPSAADETRLVLLRFALESFVGLALVLYFVVAWLHDDAGDVVASEMAMGSVLGTLGLAVFLEQRLTGQWLRQTRAPFGRARFMLGYFRSQPWFDRFYEFGFGAVLLALAGRALHSDFLARVEPWDNWLATTLSAATFGVMMFWAARHSMLALLSLIPVPRKRTVAGIGHGA